MAKNAMEVNFCFVPWKVCSLFLECQNQGFCEATIKTANGKLGTTPHINNRLHGMHILSLILLRKPSKISFEFFASSGWFCGKQSPNGAYLTTKTKNMQDLCMESLNVICLQEKNLIYTFVLAFLIATVQRAQATNTSLPFVYIAPIHKSIRTRSHSLAVTKARTTIIRLGVELQNLCAHDVIIEHDRSRDICCFG
jgi:hypothetical protein